MASKWRPLLVALSTLVTAMVTVSGTLPARAADAPPQIVVDLGQRTGPVRHGGNGALYGLSDDGVPSDNILQPLKISSIAQKAPNGLQHPNGDALVVADSFLRTGGGYVQIYLQDIYPSWPYDNLGIQDYLQKVDRIAEAVVASPHRDRFVYVPFNEPDWIWYGLSTSDAAAYPRNRDRFLQDWTTVYRRIHAIDPRARIAGPNEAFYDARFLPEFLRYAEDNGVLPDIVSWHELPTNQLRFYRGNYAAYRQLERQVGLDALPININEWGGRRDLSVPGHLVQWISMFEDTKVDAGGQAYWDAAGNLSGNVSQTNRPTGSWWLFKQYADMTGDTVSFTPPQYNVVDTLQGLASIDDAKRQAHILLGGAAGDADVSVRNVPAAFGDTVHVTISKTDWSGYDADAPPPLVLEERDVSLRGGSLTVPLRGLNEMAAYQIVLSPGGNGTRPALYLPWTASSEAENATIVAGTVYTQGTPANFNGYATSGTRDVGSLNQSDSSVTFSVAVPQTGRYRLSILYGNQAPEPSQQVLRVDGGEPRFVEYPPTLNWTYRARKDVEIELSAGAHQLTLAKSDPRLGTARGEAVLDRIDLELLPADGRPIPQRYEAEQARTSGSVTYSYDRAGQLGAGYVQASKGAEVTFVISVPADDYYDIDTRHFSPARPGAVSAGLALDGRALDGVVLRAGSDRSRWQVDRQRLFLIGGVHRFTAVPQSRTPLRLDRVTVTTATDGPRPVQTIEAEADGNQLAGTAVRESNPFASGGQQVSWVGNGTGNTLTLTVQAAQAGQHVLVVHYANNERAGEHQYNANIISRATEISVNGGAPDRWWFRNTWSWSSFWALGVPVTLKQGSNTITLGNASGFAPNFDRFEIAPLRVELG